MYHRHILTRDKSEMIRKVYMKQTENSCKGDWISLVRNDFSFIEDEINDEWILKTGKDEYYKYIKEQVKNAAFKN